MAKYMTQQRKSLLDYLNRHSDEVLSVEEIASALEKEAISKSSVYRNLSNLENEGKVRRKYSGAGREILYQYIGAEECRSSLHLSCRVCGRTFHMTADGAEQLVSTVLRTDGFAVDKGATVLYGVCKNCRK